MAKKATASLEPPGPLCRYSCLDNYLYCLAQAAAFELEQKAVHASGPELHAPWL